MLLYQEEERADDGGKGSETGSAWKLMASCKQG